MQITPEIGSAKIQFILIIQQVLRIFFIEKRLLLVHD
jgi:hypothetical protein